MGANMTVVEALGRIVAHGLECVVVSDGVLRGGVRHGEGLIVVWAPSFHLECIGEVWCVEIDNHRGGGGVPYELRFSELAAAVELVLAMCVPW